MAALPYKVECKPAGQAYYSVIAAFDCERPATGYAGDCALANLANQYRVKKGKLLLGQFGPDEGGNPNIRRAG